MLQKAALYFHTVRYMKPSQVYYRVKKVLKGSCSLGSKTVQSDNKIQQLRTIPELDYDPEFLERFSVDKLMCGELTFLHCTRKFKWNGNWEVQDCTALWNFNLHYFEYLHVFAKAFEDTKEECYLSEIKKAIRGWIQNNPKKNGGPGWSSYTISLRITNWLSCYANLWDELNADDAFIQEMVSSVGEQYRYLACHLEKDILGNHYFEDLKAMILCSMFFGDVKTRCKVLKEFKKECKEQILSDGMHFELSPMYHKIILEDVLRIAWVLRSAGEPDLEIESYIKPMLDVAYSFENGLDRVPLFNDGGNNVTKGLQALLETGRNYFGVKPDYKCKFPDAGYYLFHEGEWKLIVDAGKPGSEYIPGHAHCDAMSFELFYQGHPVFMNSGTYAYQCEERAFFRSTQAHNTVKAADTEQSQCWGAFRLARRAKVEVLRTTDSSIEMLMKDYKGHATKRKIQFKDSNLIIHDSTQKNTLSSFLHVGNRKIWFADKQHGQIDGVGTFELKCDKSSVISHKFSSEYGKMEDGNCLKIEGENELSIKISL